MPNSKWRVGAQWHWKVLISPLLAAGNEFEAALRTLAAFYGISFRLDLPELTKFRCCSLIGQISVLSA